MDLPLNVHDVRFIVVLIRKHLRQKGRKYDNPHLASIKRDQDLLARLHQACPDAFIDDPTQSVTTPLTSR